MTAIGVAPSSFYNLVKDGIIPAVMLPGRKEAVYPLSRIQQYRRAQQVVMDLYSDENSYDFGLAIREDLPEIRALVASESGGESHTIPQVVMEAWIRKNPEALRVLRKGSEIVGYISLFPAPLETIMKRLSGEYWNRTIPLDDIQPFVPKTPYPLYIAEMVAKKDEGRLNPRHYGMRLISETAKLFLGWAQEGIIFTEVYAVGTSEEGIALCRSLGMQPVDIPEGTRRGRIPFGMNIRQNTKSLLIADYCRAVTGESERAYPAPLA
jgi:hypothetical protein